MGPRSVERGKDSLLSFDDRFVRASMGPRSVERGKDRPLRIDSARSQASMGPRSVERGKRFDSENRTDGKTLQWGRVLLNAESRTAAAVTACRKSLQWGRVLLNAERSMPPRFIPLAKNASMGPRSVERGKGMPFGAARLFAPLQWGRVLLNAESCPVCKGWGRERCFNGAAFC